MLEHRQQPAPVRSAWPRPRTPAARRPVTSADRELDRWGRIAQRGRLGEVVGSSARCGPGSSNSACRTSPTVRWKPIRRRRHVLVEGLAHQIMGEGIPSWRTDGSSARIRPHGRRQGVGKAPDGEALTRCRTPSSNSRPITAATLRFAIVSLSSPATRRRIRAWTSSGIRSTGSTIGWPASARLSRRPAGPVPPHRRRSGCRRYVMHLGDHCFRAGRAATRLT